MSSKSILIVGGGTFGTSTAYHLSLQPSRYSPITVLDRHPVPSAEAAGNDINKVIRADYPDPLYARMATEAIARWRDPDSIFAGLHHQTGWIYAAAAGSASMQFAEASAATAKKLGLEVPTEMSADELRRKWPMITGKMEGWKSFWNGSAGWADARGGLTKMAEDAQRNGVLYVTGEKGWVKQLLFDETGRCVGAKSADGTAHFADLVILSAGAAAARLLDMKGQLVAKGHTVGHIKMTPEEIKRYADMPIVDHLEGGLVFPPQKDGLFKIGACHFVTNYAGRTVSLPRYRSDNPTDGIPKPIEMKLRSWMKEFVPELADREWSETRICWDADMPDYHFLIDEHPEHPCLQLAVGGSAHGFKFLPVVGKYIVDMIEGRLDAETKNKWRWRPGAGLGGPTPHPTPLVELSEMAGWETEKAEL